MTYITQLSRRKTISSLRIITMALIGAAMFVLQSSSVQAQWSSADGQGNINNTNSGKVGIGTSSPLYTLDVNGGTNGFRAKAASSSGSDTIATFESTGGIRAIVRANGNVGIGTTSPGGRLHITGDNTASGGYPLIKLENTQSGGHSWWLYSGANGVAGNLGIYDETAAAYRLTITSAGSFGIGTTTPNKSSVSRALTVNGSSDAIYELAVGDVRKGTMYHDNTNLSFTNNASGALTLGTNNAERFRIDASGNVGIGTTSPVAALDVVNSVTAGVGTARFKNTNANTQVIIDSPASQSANVRLDDNGYPVWYIGNNASNDRFRLLNSNANGTAEVFTVLQSGNLGLGTTSPSTRLHVVGDVTVTGNIAAKYQDVAEWVPSTQELPSGTVVVLDSAKSNHVNASAQAYDTKVAGVISEQPGITLGESGKNKVLVATTGRVMVKVDATRAPIEVGDLLVTSDTSGLAMKSEPVNISGIQLHRPGTLIGKALEPLPNGRGEILVLLSLQ